MIWSPYFIPMQSTMQEFKAATGIGVAGIQDISIFDIPQRAMAEVRSGTRMLLSINRRQIFLFGPDGRRIERARRRAFSRSDFPIIRACRAAS